jgi:hypothetical protein
VKESIVQALVYYDIFTYPLTAEEIHQKINVNAQLEDTVAELAKLQQGGFIFCFEGLYTLRNDIGIVERRRTGNEKAKVLLEKAYQRAKFICLFPFFRGIMISGSLSKNFADEKSDLDFFIITQPKRLWIARTIFDTYRKFFVKKKNYKDYCLNYFISCDRLTIEEQNLFTATELSTLKPVWGISHYQNLIKSNEWINGYFPNLAISIDNPVLPEIDLSKKNRVEKVIDFLFANQIESVLMKMRLAWLKFKHQRKFATADFEIAFKSKAYVSKVHDKHGQKRILGLYEEKIAVMASKLV